ncbi:Uncharacterized protein ChrSV_1327 [Chromobacterium vaccinii]|nr:Uncharacterized protein ChrSW_1327 [Chromobacterium vaccinii]QND88785.1 Uncharacterized protein ChrSV_1327 [Chromobacterium vaccinii]
MTAATATKAESYQQARLSDMTACTGHKPGRLRQINSHLPVFAYFSA